MFDIRDWFLILLFIGALGSFFKLVASLQEEPEKVYVSQDMVNEVWRVDQMEVGEYAYSIAEVALKVNKERQLFVGSSISIHKERRPWDNVKIIRTADGFHAVLYAKVKLSSVVFRDDFPIISLETTY